ncbi:MAG: hypothetical protein ACR2Q4_00555 [Geminicoccaceae bacterium]
MHPAEIALELIHRKTEAFGAAADVVRVGYMVGVDTGIVAELLPEDLETPDDLVPQERSVADIVKPDLKPLRLQVADEISVVIVEKALALEAAPRWVNPYRLGRPDAAVVFSNSANFSIRH